jgi:hypothetical protein
MRFRRLFATGVSALVLSVSTAPLAAPAPAIAKPCDGAKKKTGGNKGAGKKGKGGKAGKCGR